ncbi:ribonuclease [Oxalobacteraceae bacterium OM1]|nr:ribonuclease [Oxalobacteraceae bacterium OM1]
MSARYAFLRTWTTFLAVLLFAVVVQARETPGIGVVRATDLPLEARETLALIRRGGPFPYAKDGVVFGNYEGVLPKRKRGYYHEFTVKTPRARNRGARRIITGGDPVESGEYYYTDDHYATFRRIQE